MLAPVLQPAHRAFEALGEPGDADLLRREDPLVAEPAADIGRDHPDAGEVHVEAFGEPVAHDMRELRGRDHGELAQPRVPLGEHALALDRRHALARGAHLARHLDRGAGGDARDVVLDDGLQEDVVAPVLVDQRRVGVAGGQHVGDRRQDLEIDRHGVGHVLGLGPGPGDADRDRLAHLAHLVRRQRRLGRGLEPRQRRDRADRLDARHVGVGEDLATGCRPGCRFASMRACATGLRTKAASNWPARPKSPTKRPRPRISRSSSLRAIDAPTP